MGKAKSAVNPYINLSLPQLCKLCYERDIPNYFGKYEDEIAKMLLNYDNKSKPKVQQENVMGKQDIEEIDDDITIDDDDIEDEDKPVTKRVQNRLNGDDEEDDTPELDDDEPEEKPAKKSAKKAVADDDTPELDDDEPEEKPAKKSAKKAVADDDEPELDTDDDTPELDTDDETEEKPVAKKAVAEQKPVKAGKKSAAVTEDDDADVPAAKPPKKSKKEVPAAEGKGRGRHIDPDADAPFAENTAGYYCFKALQKAKGHKMEQLVEYADKLIAKNDAKAPSNTKQKMQIIMQEVNSGKRGKWGKIVKGDNGKYTYEAA